MKTQINEENIYLVDNVFDDYKHDIIKKYCYNAEFRLAKDRNDTPYAGFMHTIPDNEYVYILMTEYIKNNFQEILELKMYDIRINCFAPRERTFFHRDLPTIGYTFLFYINDGFEIDECGETQFVIDGKMYGIQPKPNRICLFDSRILHKATSFMSRHRFTIAVKYK